MIVLLDTSHDLSTCAAELGCEVGTLLTPLTRYRLREPERPWAIDNGAYARFDSKAFRALLAREEHHKEACIFVTAPDVVASAQRTLELFSLWRPRLAGWKIALACQDGQEALEIPWDDIDAIFIGGSTNWKLSRHATDIVKVAKQHFDKWVHIGRVNDPGRYEAFAELGADSCDGTGISRYTHMREKIGARDNQENLWATS